MKDSNSSNELMAIFDNAPVVLILVDKEREIININKAGLDTVGISKGEVLGQVAGQLLNCVNAFDGDNVVCGTTEKCKNCSVRNPITDTFVTGRNHYKEPGFIYVDDNGQKIKLELLVSTSMIKVNGTDYVLLTIDDITKLKVQERELIKVNHEKDRFISILSHDLRSPFALIMGLSEVLKENIETFDTNQLEEIAKELSDAANSSYMLLDDLLAWAKSQTDSINYAPETLLLSEQFDNVYSSQKHNAAIKDISLEYSENESIAIYADTNMLRTVLRNMISNAVKFTPNNGTITISGENLATTTVVKVSDNGVGIPADKIDSILDNKTFQTTNGTNGEKGSGFGLLLCKEFVEKHKGTISVSSQEGEGTTFTMIFPKGITKS